MTESVLASSDLPPRRILFLDIDGPLTTERSRGMDWEAFDRDAVQAFKLLLGEGKPDLVVVHSTWRKLPHPDELARSGQDWGYCWSHTWFRGHCHKQGLSELADLPLEDAPFDFHRFERTDRTEEIEKWLDDNHVSGNRYVILDDEDLRDAFAERRMDTHVVVCDDRTGLTLDQARAAVRFWEHLGTTEAD